MPFETGDATPEQIAAKAEHRREEERARLVNMATNKVRALFFESSYVVPIIL